MLIENGNLWKERVLFAATAPKKKEYGDSNNKRNLDKPLGENSMYLPENKSVIKNNHLKW